MLACVGPAKHSNGMSVVLGLLHCSSNKLEASNRCVGSVLVWSCTENLLAVFHHHSIDKSIPDHAAVLGLLIAFLTDIHGINAIDRVINGGIGEAMCSVPHCADLIGIPCAWCNVVVTERGGGTLLVKIYRIVTERPVVASFLLKGQAVHRLTFAPIFVLRARSSLKVFRHVTARQK